MDGTELKVLIPVVFAAILLGSGFVYSVQSAQSSYILSLGRIVYPELSKLYVNDSQIRLADGTPIVLKGAAMAGPDIDYISPPVGGEWERVKEPYFDYCKRWGFNMVRLSLSWDLLQPNLTDALNATYLSRIDQVISWAKARGIYIIVDLHYQNHYPVQPPWGIDFWYPYKTNTPTLKNQWLELWRLLAQHYEDEEAVAFFGLCNEPFLPADVGSSETPEFMNAWMTMANEACLAIHSIDPNRIVGIDPPSWSHAENMRYIQPIADPNPNVVYTPHYYWLTSVTYTSNPLDILDGAATNYHSYLRPAITWMDTYNRPVLITEMGNIDPNRPDLELMLRDLLSILKQNNMGWIYWMFVRSDNYGLLNDPTYSGSGIENPMVAVLKEHTQGI